MQLHVRQPLPLLFNASANDCISIGLELPANLSSSSKRKACKMASDEKVKIDMNKKAIVTEITQTTIVAGIGEVIRSSSPLFVK